MLNSVFNYLCYGDVSILHTLSDISWRTPQSASLNSTAGSRRHHVIRHFSNVLLNYQTIAYKTKKMILWITKSFLMNYMYTSTHVQKQNCFWRLNLVDFRSDMVFPELNIIFSYNHIKHETIKIFMRDIILLITNLTKSYFQGIFLLSQ